MKTNTDLHCVLRNKINVTQFAQEAVQDTELFSRHNVTPEVVTPGLLITKQFP